MQTTGAGSIGQTGATTPRLWKIGPCAAAPWVRLAMVVLVCLMIASCTASDPERGTFELSSAVVLEGLNGPTQLAVGDDGMWYIAQLGGGENDRAGQVLRVDPATPAAQPVVLLAGLDKPTGIAVFDNRLWVMERRALSNSELDGTDRVVVVEDMVFNGRSQGSLTVDGDRLLFNTSGRISERTAEPQDPQQSSGVLWSITAGGVIEPVASGFKHAYAQTRGPDGTLWTTELADGTYDGTPALDELVAVNEGEDHGWPACVGNNRPVVEYGGTPQACAAIAQSQAVFASGATPTSVVIAPWNQATLLVALWVEGVVVAVPTSPGDAPADAVTVFAEAERPQHLVVDNQRVLLVDHAGGVVTALQPQE